jgi:hypothetical protein
MALAGILKYGWTRIQIWENGRAPSRDTAHKVREQVVTITGKSTPVVKDVDILLFATKQPKKQNANNAKSTEAPALDPVPW